MPAIPPRPRSARPAGARSRRGGRTVLAVMVFVMAAMIVDGLFGDRGLLALVRVREQHAALQAAVQAAREENDRLKAAVQRMRDDPAAIEEEVRRSLGLIRPGEKLFILKDVPSPGPVK
jgi:cell division protein FtsB